MRCQFGGGGIMSIDGLIEHLRANPSLIEVAIFVLAFGESLVLVSLLVPATVLFIAIGALHEVSGGSLGPIVLAGIAGTTLGDLVSYSIGRRLKDQLPKRWPFNAHPAWLPGAAAFLAKWGMLGLIGSKFMGPLRSVVPAACGVLQMPVLPFVLVTICASALWSLVLLAPAYYGLRLLGY